MARLSSILVRISVCAALALVAVSTRADRIDDIVKAQMAKSKTPGVSIAVIKNGKVVKAHGYGFADVEGKVPATEKTVYELGSITKQFTAVAVMMLVEQGKVSLDDRIVDRLPGLASAWKDVTVRHLLTHTSGIFNYTSLPNFSTFAKKDVTNEEVIKTVANRPLDFQPGEKWSYSNTGYHLLGMLIEKASGKRYGAFLQERIFGPLGMTHTCVNDLSAKIPNRAVGYSAKGGTVQKAPQISMTWPFSAGALISTVTDLAKWDASLGSEKLLKKSSWDQMWTPVKLNNGVTFPYGFGWGVDKLDGHRVIAHGGGIPGFSTDMARFPDDALTVVVLTNTDSANPALIRNAIARALVPGLAPKAAAIEDREPAVTALVREVLEQSAAGTLKRDRFTPEMAADIFPDKVKAAEVFLKAQGPIERLTLNARSEEVGLRKYKYLAKFKTLSLVLDLALTKDDKIAGMSMRPE